MPRWRVIVHAVVRRAFEVEAADVNGAIAAAYRTALPVEETDVREDVISVYEINKDDAARS